MLPAKYDDGFDEPSDDNRVIKGAIVKFGTDGKWTVDGVPVPPNGQYLAIGIAKFIQRWEDGKPIEIITAHPLPDVDELNAAVPKREWETDMTGNPREPYQKARAVYLLDVKTGERMTAVNSTVGQRIGVDKLQSAVMDMRRLRGPGMFAIVVLDSAPMKTKYGTKPRPHYRPVDWQLLGEGASPTAQIADASNRNEDDDGGETFDEAPWGA
jgi:hypothetical protein